MRSGGAPYMCFALRLGLDFLDGIQLIPFIEQNTHGFGCTVVESI